MFQPLAVLYDADGSIRGVRMAFFDVEGINASDKLYFPRLFECPSFAQMIKNFRVVDCNAQQCVELSAKFHYRERSRTSLDYRDQDYDEICDESDSSVGQFYCKAFSNNPNRLRIVSPAHCLLSAIDANDNIVTNLLGTAQPMYFQVIGAHVRKISFTYVNDDYYREKRIIPEYKIYDAAPFLEPNPQIKQLLPSKVLLVAPNGAYRICDVEAVKQMAAQGKIQLGNVVYDKKSDCLSQRTSYAYDLVSSSDYSLSYKDTITDLSMSQGCTIGRSGHAVINELPDQDIIIFPQDCPQVSVWQYGNAVVTRCKQIRFPAVMRETTSVNMHNLDLKILVLPREVYAVMSIYISSVENLSLPAYVEANYFEFSAENGSNTRGIDCSKYKVDKFRMSMSCPLCEAVVVPAARATTMLTLFNAKSLKAIALAPSFTPVSLELTLSDIQHDFVINLSAYCKRLILNLNVAAPVTIRINHNGIGTLSVTNAVNDSSVPINIVTNSLSSNTINSKQLADNVTYTCIRKRRSS